MKNYIQSAVQIFSFALLTCLISCKMTTEKKVVIVDKQKDTVTEVINPKILKPMDPAPAWAPDIKAEMAVVIEKLSSLGGKPIETLAAAEARRQPTPTDAVLEVMKEHQIAMPAPLCDTIGKDIPVTGGSTHLRIYTPKEGKAPYPVIVYYHGGGFVIANIDVYNGGAQGLCELSQAILVSVEYPKGPEHKFPAAHNVAFDAYKWVIQNAASFNGDPKKIAVAGESAGGNLAINISIMACAKNVQMPLYQVLVYPVANNDMNSESYQKYAAAKPLNKPMMGWFVKNYLNSAAQSSDPRISVVKANLKGLPPTLIIGAEIDPLQSEGKLLADKLNEAGVATEYKLYDGVTHEFFGMSTVIPEAKLAQQLAADKLKVAFAK